MCAIKKRTRHFELKEKQASFTYGEIDCNKVTENLQVQYVSRNYNIELCNNKGMKLGCEARNRYLSSVRNEFSKKERKKKYLYMRFTCEIMMEYFSNGIF